jgi:hypothetical protein
LIQFDLVKSYELREGSAVFEVTVANFGRSWKFEFCRDMSLALGVLEQTYFKGRVGDKPRRLPRHQRAQAHNSTHYRQQLSFMYWL